MKSVMIRPGDVVNLGRRGENLALEIVFDISEWVTAYGDGTAQLLHKRYGDKSYYPVTVTQDGDQVSWAVTNADTAVSGTGMYELRYSTGEVLAKAKLGFTKTQESADGFTEEPPEAQQDWVDQVLDAAAKTQAAATNPPKLSETNTWLVWDADAGEYVDTGVSAVGGGNADLTGYVRSVNGVEPDKNGNVEIDIPDSGGNVGGVTVTGATVGQTVKIAAVDENGVPTAWEPVSFPGESGWTEIGTVTLQEDVGVWDDYIENVNPSFHSFDEVAILFHFTAAEGNASQASASFKFRADNHYTFGFITIPYAIRTSGTFDFLVAFRKIGDLGGFVLSNSVVNVALASPKITGFNLYGGGEGKLYGAGSTATFIGRNVA